MTVKNILHHPLIPRRSYDLRGRRNVEKNPERVSYRGGRRRSHREPQIDGELQSTGTGDSTSGRDKSTTNVSKLSSFE
jgi:hypothetical protein